MKIAITLSLAAITTLYSLPSDKSTLAEQQFKNPAVKKCINKITATTAQNIVLKKDASVSIKTLNAEIGKIVYIRNQLQKLGYYVFDISWNEECIEVDCLQAKAKNFDTLDKACEIDPAKRFWKDEASLEKAKLLSACKEKSKKITIFHSKLSSTEDIKNLPSTLSKKLSVARENGKQDLDASSNKKTILIAKLVEKEFKKRAV